MDGLANERMDVIFSHYMFMCVSTVGLSCVGKYRCGSSSQCIISSAQCDGQVHCDNGEDELGCGEADTHTCQCMSSHFTHSVSLASKNRKTKQDKQQGEKPELLMKVTGLSLRIRLGLGLRPRQSWI